QHRLRGDVDLLPRHGRPPVLPSSGDHLLRLHQDGLGAVGSADPGNAEDARDAHVLRNKKKVIKMLSMVVILFAVCWAPLQTYHVLQEIYPAINRYRYINIIWFCCHWLAMSNSCCNPFIYAIYNEKFKREFRLKFRCCFRHLDSLEALDIEKSKCHFPVGGPEVHLHKATLLSSPPDLRRNGGSSASPYVISSPRSSAPHPPPQARARA
ncbi:neuropeptide GPCR A22, partial [Penaeus vannamei]